jgi:hypothetical protein
MNMALLSVIRRWALRDQLSIREIARRTGLSRMRPVDRDPPCHRFIDRGIPHKGVGRRMPRQMEVNGIVAEPSSLPELAELDFLDLE